MLQDVYKGMGGGKASSLYCVWVCGERESYPVAVWIDSEMRPFDGQIEPDAMIQIAVECAPEESQGV